MKHTGVSLLMSALAIACGESSVVDGAHVTGNGEEATTPLFELLDSSATGITFINELVETDSWNILRYEYLFNGGGVAVGDVDNDGLQDLYFVSNTGSDKLFKNLGGFRFADITASAGLGRERGYKSGVTMVDINNDGLLDIHVCRDALSDAEARRNLLYINNGDLTFTERAKEFGIDDPGYSTQAYFFDMDGDNDLDMFLVNHPGNMVEANNIKVTQDASGKYNLYLSEDLRYSSDRLYRNDNGKFKDISASAGIVNEAFGLSAVICDINNDGAPDIYVCNDYVMPDQLWINQGGGKFIDKFDDHFKSCSFSSMGSDMADMNNDGLPDLVTADMTARDRYRYHTLLMATNFDKYTKLVKIGLKAQFSANHLQLNNGNGSFSNIGHLSGIAFTDWSWSTLFADLDNDGLKDLLITNGYFKDVSNNDYLRYTMDSLQKELRAGHITLTEWTSSIPSVKVRSFLFRNEGDLTFSDKSDEWNAGPPAFSNGALYADLDNDGYLDLVMNNINDQAFILRNRGAETIGNGHVRFDLKAGPGRSAYGAKVELVLNDGTRQTQWIQPTRGFLSCSETVAHFGTGKRTKADRVEITWADGHLQVVENPALNSTLQVVRSEKPSAFPPNGKPEPLFVDRSAWLPSSMRHSENDFIDLKREPLLMHFLSQEGPAAAVADVNGDGLHDIYVGGSTGTAGKLYVQSSSGAFTEVPQPAFGADAEAEDVDALFFDADGDGNLDLYVASGGNELPIGSIAYMDRLYFGDGKGGFLRRKDALPTAFISSGCVAAADIDGDGDMDLFVGGRQTPGRYPEASASQLLRNDNGRFTDVTETWAKELRYSGMVTDAQFADLDGDGGLGLVVVGEWLPVTTYDWTGERFENTTAQRGLDKSYGWWCSVAVDDMDGDGKPEILAGNAGLNTPLRASVAEPLTLYYKDFDGNGSMDAVLCENRSGKLLPVQNRDRMLDQMIMLKKRFLRYHTYAHASLKDIFKPEELAGAGILKANTLHHTLFRHAGKGSYEATPLPNRAQSSMARAASLIDTDGNGTCEAIVAGNHYGTDAQFGRYDACVGLLLSDTGTGDLHETPPHMSGLDLGGHVRRLLPITVKGRPCLLVVRNNEAWGLVEMLGNARSPNVVTQRNP